MAKGHHPGRPGVPWYVIRSLRLAAFIQTPACRTLTPSLLPVFGLLFYALHAHSSNPTLLPGLPARHQPILRQAIFFVASTCAGCYLIHISNKYGYLAVMKQAPPVGCLWIWAVVELDLPWAVLSLVGASAFFWQGGYSIK
jgi:hypothetical protein